MDTRVGLDAVEKRKLFCSFRKSNPDSSATHPVKRPERSHLVIVEYGAQIKFHVLNDTYKLNMTCCSFCNIHQDSSGNILDIIIKNDYIQNVLNHCFIHPCNELNYVNNVTDYNRTASNGQRRPQSRTCFLCKRTREQRMDNEVNFCDTHSRY